MAHRRTIIPNASPHPFQDREHHEEREQEKREAAARIQRLEYLLQILTRGERKTWTTAK